ncbi:MAG: SMI1/KNR4 family protein [Phycisphaerae bacterium]|nr:SMI1/KNR4 family protein [Phycisphaerae bacterium]
MKPHITSLEPPVTAEILARAEQHLGFRLPEDYVGFLRENNGGRPTPNTVPTPSFPGSAATDLKLFYAIGAKMECYDLVWNYEIWRRDSPANLLPIACDSGGSAFCLSVTGEDSGRIYYWDWHREPHRVRTRYLWVYTVADSLEEFLGSFREPRREEVGPADVNSLVWRTDWITAEIRRDDEFLKIGQYLHLCQHLPPGVTGWTMKKIEVPEHWSVRSVGVADGVITVSTRDGRVFQLTQYNVGMLNSAILEVGTISDEELDRIWCSYAGVQQV